jgi:hypothetical protein
MVRRNNPMKKLLFALFTGASAFFNAQIPSLVVPAPVAFQNPMKPMVILEHFHRAYAHIQPEWVIEGKYYTVRYVDPDSQLGHIITYDHNGIVVKIENEVMVNECPEGVKYYYMTKCRENGSAVWWIEDYLGNEGYYFIYRSKMFLFDKEGRYLKRKNLN